MVVRLNMAVDEVGPEKRLEIWMHRTADFPCLPPVGSFIRYGGGSCSEVTSIEFKLGCPMPSLTLAPRVAHPSMAIVEWLESHGWGRDK